MKQIAITYSKSAAANTADTLKAQLSTWQTELKLPNKLMPLWHFSHQCRGKKKIHIQREGTDNELSDGERSCFAHPEYFIASYFKRDLNLLDARGNY